MLENIKSWEDIVILKGSEIEVPYKFPKNKKQVTLNACYKLQVIAELFNDGWYPDWKNSDQVKYYPYFEFDQSRSGWVFFVLYDCDLSNLGSDFYYKDEETAKIASTIFLSVYVEWLTGEISKKELKDYSAIEIAKQITIYQMYLLDNNLPDDSNTISIVDLIDFVENNIEAH